MLETNDPKLTAFAFGELPAEEQAEVAALVAASPALASEVAAIRALGEQLTSLLSTETCPALSKTERTRILQAAEQDRLAEVSVVDPPAVQPAWYRQRRIWAYTTAAALLVAVTLFFAIPLVVRYTQEPRYRSSAWLCNEDVYIVIETHRYDNLEEGVPHDEPDGNSKRISALDLEDTESELYRQEQALEYIDMRIGMLRTEFAAPGKVTLLRKAEPSSLPDSEISIWSFWFGKLAESHIEKLARLKHMRGGFMKTQVQLVYSEPVLEQVLARTDVAQYKPLANAVKPVEWLQERLSVNTGNNTELFIIDFVCDDPNYAALITNAIVEAYFHAHTQDEHQRSTRLLELFEDERARRLEVIQQLRDQLEEMKAKAEGKVRTPSGKE